MGLIAGLREKRERGVLATELAEEQARGVALREAVEALLGCVKALVLDIDELDAAGFKQALDETLTRLRAEAPPAKLAERVARDHRATLDLADRQRDYLKARDEELKRIIDLLRDGLTAVTDRNERFNRSVLDRGARIEAAAQLGDLVRIRQTVAQEVQGLRQAVAEKQANDAARTSELHREVVSLRRDVESARLAASIDPLTGAANRAAFDAELDHRLAVSASGGETFSMILVDVDHFKAINDTHGHQVGDRALIALVAFCRERVRRGDLIARWGGEELALILPSASLRVALRKARALVADLAKREWAIEEDGTKLGFTVSAGVAERREGDTADSLVGRADRALYRAKHEGRNRALAEE